MHSESFLIDLILILSATKFLGLVTKSIHMPQVVGALIAGLVLGPACLGYVEETTFLENISELGVIILMFAAGLETDVSKLKESGKHSFIIAFLGALVPLIGGFAVACAFNSPTTEELFLQNLFIGIILTATSVSITVETLKELGKLSTNSGNAILGAALIDDILGIMGLTIVTSLAGSDISVSVVLLKIICFFILSGLLGLVTRQLFVDWVSKYEEDLQRFVIVSFIICLIYSYVAEHIFGVASITGAFIAGLLVTNTGHTHYIEARFSTLSYMLLSPVFFASIGLKVTLPEMTPTIISFTITLIVVAILTKIIGCMIAGKICKYTPRESFQIGTGMVSRGEVALIMTTQGTPLGLINPDFFAPIVIMVIATTVLSPILLKVAFSDKQYKK
ncbi:MAG: cation:proton antiporter [bacterium]